MRRLATTIAMALVMLAAPLLPVGTAHARDVDFFISFGSGHGYSHHRPHGRFGHHRYQRHFGHHGSHERYHRGHGKRFVFRHAPRAHRRHFHGHRKFAGPFECFPARGDRVVCLPVRR